MKVTAEKLEKSQYQLDVEFEPEVIQSAIDRGFRKLSAKVTLPGFRKGKAPRQLLERAIGEDALFQEGLELLVSENYPKAVEEADIIPVDSPEIDVISKDPLVVRFVVPVKPEVTVGDYASIKKDPPVVSISDDDVTTFIDSLRNQRATWDAVEKAADKGDKIKGDFRVTTVTKAEKPVLYAASGDSLIQGTTEKVLMDSKDMTVELADEGQEPWLEIARQMVGVKAGEKKEFDIVLPDDFEMAEEAGKEAHFVVNVSEVQVQNVPALDDSFAKQVKFGKSQMDSIEDLRTRAQKFLEVNKTKLELRKLADEIVDELVASSQVELPAVLIEREVDDQIARFQEELRADKMTFAQYVKMTGKTEDDIRSQVRERSEAKMKRYLVLTSVAGAESIEATEQELKEGVESNFPGQELPEDLVQRFLSDPGRRADLEMAVKLDKTVNFLLGQAVGEEILSLRFDESPELSDAVETVVIPDGSETEETVAPSD